MPSAYLRKRAAVVIWATASAAVVAWTNMRTFDQRTRTQVYAA